MMLILRQVRSCRDPAALIVAVWLICVTGCGQRAGEIFPPLDPPLVWPGPPEPPRVQYVGQLVTSADLKPAVPFGQGLGDALFGKRPIRSMLTPYALCTDGRDQLFVADSNAQVVHVFNMKTRRYRQIVPANELRRFAQPVGIAHDPITKRLFVSDAADGSIYIFDAAGYTLRTIKGDFLQRPCGMAYDVRRQMLYVADAALHQILVLSPMGELIARLGQRGMDPGQFNFPTNVAVDSASRLYVSDSLNFRVQQFDSNLSFIRAFGRKGDMPGYFSQPKGLAVDSSNQLYVVDANFEAVQVFDDRGRLLLSFGQEGRGPGEFWLPAGIHIDASDRIWVADSYNRRVVVLKYLPEAPP